MSSSGGREAREFYDETIFDNSEIVAGERILLHAERPLVEKHDVRGRLAIVTRRAVTVRKTIEVDLIHEVLDVRYDVGDATEMIGVEAETFSILLHAEDVEIVKHVRVVEEVRLSKKRAFEHKRFDVTLRHETLDVLDARPT